MKKTAIILAAVFVSSLLYASGAPAPVSPAVRPAAEAVTKTAEADKALFDEVMGIFKGPEEKQEESVAQPAAAMEAEYAESAEEDVFTLAGKLLIAANIFSAGIAAVSWINLSQGMEFYEQMYNDINNTTLENYELLRKMRADVLNAETRAWVSAGIAAALISYTVADALVIRGAFPLKPELKPGAEAQVLTLNYRF